MKNRKFKRITALALSMAMVAGLGVTGRADSSEISVKIGDWPTESNEAWLEQMNKFRDGFMEANPDINIVEDTYTYDTKTFTMKAAANQLPNMYGTWFTEIDQIINAGYAADITDAMKEHGFDTGINPDLLKLMTDDEGRIYGIPKNAYEQAFYINKDIFKEAGLVNEDGSIMEPDTWEDVAEFAQTIKEKTGKAGFIIPTTNNCGGWQFLNIAWAYGVEFEKQREDGTWEATFDTQEARDALQYMKDLKWKYDVLVDDSVISTDDMNKYFGTGQAAMMIKDVGYSGRGYGLDNSALYATKMPKGPAGRFAQMGGNLYMFSADSTPEQIEAGFKWLEYIGNSPKMTDEQVESFRQELEAGQDSLIGVITERDSFEVWTDPETQEKRRALREQYANVNYDDYKNYFEATDVEITPEPAACAQQLYAILDGCIQEVFTNENADVDALITNACSDFQTNYLDKMDY